MNKFFTKKEADTIISLLNSKDIDNNKLGMNLIFTHKKYKSFLKLIIVRYPRAAMKEYQNISTKYSFKQVINIYNRTFEKLDAWDRPKLFKFFIDFIKKRTK